MDSDIDQMIADDELASAYQTYTASDEVELERISIRDEISHYADAIIALKIRLNSLAPINRLFPELLGNIFVHISRMDGEGRTGPFYKWIQVSYVCHYWREVALGCPRMWSHITLTTQGCVREMFRRSKQAPLSINADFITLLRNYDYRLLQLVAEHMHRVQDIRLAPVTILPHSSPMPLDAPAPLLQSLVLGDVSGMIALPKLLFNGQAPLLQNLEISIRDAFTWRKGFHHLRMKRLVISNLSKNAAAHVRLSNVIDALHEMPLLETLQLQDVLPLQVVETPSNNRIALPHLCSLKLTSNTLDFGGLLGFLEIPANCTMLLRGASIGDVKALQRDLATLLANHCLRSLKVVGLYEEGFNLQAWTTSPTEIPEENTPAIQIGLYGASRRYESYLKPLSRLCRILPTPEVNDVTIQGLTRLPELIWIKCFGGMRNVQTLRLRGTSIVDLAVSLRGRLIEGTNPPRYFLPRLTNIVFRFVNFPKGEAGRDEGFRELEDAFIERATEGIGLHSLDIAICYNVTPLAVTLLRDIVPVVEWDDYQRGNIYDSGPEW